MKTVVIVMWLQTDWGSSGYWFLWATGCQMWCGVATSVLSVLRCANTLHTDLGFQATFVLQSSGPVQNKGQGCTYGALILQAALFMQMSVFNCCSA